MEKKNAAIIGYGGMGSWHGEYLRHSDVVNLMGVYDFKPERCEAAEKNGIHAYSSLKALLSDPAVDFVTIAVPNDMHKPLAIEAMKAGKHVISEKPVTLSSADLQEMFDASDKYHRLFTVHQNRRWDGEFLLMRDIYHSGDLGQVYRMESRVHGSRGIPGDWRGTPEHGGGMILDWGIHLIDQIMGIVDDKTLRKVFCHCISMPRFYMTGADGSAIIPDWCQPAHVVWCHNYNEKEVVPVKTAAGITKTMAPRDEKSIASKDIPQPASDVHDFYRNFVRAICGEEEQIVTHHQMMVDMKIMEAAFESDRTGLPVAVELKF